jgi:DNA topoisomerase-1
VEATEFIESAREAGLRYLTDEAPGITRQRRGRSFSYRWPDGKAVDDETTLGRIRSLAIPPAWTSVWISPQPRGHIQATGRDQRGRKQYRYHPRWHQVRDQDKYERMMDFARALPRIRRRVARDLRRPGLPRDKVLAVVVWLLETTMMRVGNEEYAQENGSFGLTTLRRRHAKVSRGGVRFFFKGKSGKEHAVGFRNARLARVIRQVQDLPGQALFQYLDAEGRRQPVDSDAVNAYIRMAAGGDFTAKDFRTWAGTVLAARALQEFSTVDSEAQAKRNVVEAIESVARELGNTRTVCRKCYIHPAVIDSYLDGTMLGVVRQRAEQALKGPLRRLRPEEAAVLALLERRLRKESQKARAA